MNPSSAPAPPTDRSRPPGLRRLFPPRRLAPIVLVLLSLAHGLTYALIIPIWQAPDEPLLYEYAALLVRLGRVPQASDHLQDVDAAITNSLNQERFWMLRLGQEPEVYPKTISEAQDLAYMPRQVGGDPPLYFALAAIPLRLTADWPIARQVRLLRIMNALLLPVVVVCAYGAGREIAPETPHLALAMASFAALHPMFALIGATLSNDGPSNLVGAALCWATLRMTRRGLTWRRALVIGLLLIIGLQIKRTVAPYLLILPCMGGVALARAWRRWPRRKPAFAGGLALCGGLLALWLASQIDWGAAGFWLNPQPGRRAARTSQHGIGPALDLRAGDESYQALPIRGVELARDRDLTFSVRLHSASGASGRLIIHNDLQRLDTAFAVSGDSHPTVTVHISPTASRVMFGIVADSGDLLASRIEARLGAAPGNLLANGDLSLPAIKPGAPLRELIAFGMAKEALWSFQNRAILTPFPYRHWAYILHVSFWGHFGWMSIPFVSGSRWSYILIGMILAALLGLVRWAIARKPAGQARQVLVIAGMAAGALALMFASSLIAPASEQIRQGRYLFPFLLPFGGLLALGQIALLPARWRGGWLLAWTIFWLVFAGQAMALLWRYYGV